MNLPKYSKGFTLIELLVSLSIIAIIAGGIIPTFTSYIRSQNVKQAQEQLKSDLRTLQNRALTGSLSDRGINGEKVSYWGATFSSDSGSSIEYFISSNTSCPLTNSEPQGTFLLPSNVMYYGSGGRMFFSIKNGDISGYLGPIELKLRENDDPVLVKLNSAGLIWTDDTSID